MKHLTLVVLALFLSVSAYSQVELKVNPIGLLFGSYNLLAEFPASESFGIEGKVGYFSRNEDFSSEEWTYGAFNLEAAGKYYFNPREGFDRFYVGPYVKFNTGNWEIKDGNSTESSNSTRVSLGLLFGQKWVGRNGLVFEIGLGAGRALVNTIDNNDLDGLLFDLDLTGRLAIGYRFGGK